MPPLIVPSWPAIPPATVLALVITMPFGLIVPVLVIVLVIVELLIAMPVMVVALVQPGAVVLVKEVLQAASAGGAPPPISNAATELDASSRPTLRRRMCAPMEQRLWPPAVTVATHRSPFQDMSRPCDEAMNLRWMLLASPGQAHDFSRTLHICYSPR
jgi:hypothetical protein